MRIGFFTDGFLPQPNGVATSVYESAKELERRGHEVIVIAPRYPGYIDHDLNVIRLASLKVVKQPEIRVALNLPDKSLRKVVSLEFDIIHGHSGGPITLLGSQIARAKKIPIIITYHTLWNRYTHYILKGKVVSPKMIERATKIFGNSVDRIIAPTEGVERELRSYGVKKPISIVPSGIDIEKFARAKPGFLRKKIKVARDPIILFVGRLGREKSVDFLIRAFEKILRDAPRTHFAIVGEGSEKKRLIRLAVRLGVARNTHVVGEVKNEEMYKMYKDASAFVFSSNTETQGLVISEALASGVPVVAIDDPAYKCIENGKNGYLVDRDENSFAQKTLAIIKDKRLHSEMSKHAIEIAQKFSVKSTIDSLESIYFDLLDSHNTKNVARIMDVNERAEKIYTAGLFFWLTVFFLRLTNLFFYDSSSYPVFNIGGEIFYHAKIGFFLLAAFVALFLHKRKVSLFALILLGVGIAFIADELASLILGSVSIQDYWNPLNLIPIVIVGIIVGIFTRTNMGDRPKFYINTRIQKHINPPNPKISVVVPAYNEGKFIEPTLKSFLNQTYKNFELIVVDNNSTDDTAAVAERFGARVIRESIKGVAGARQAGFMSARGTIIASTDADSIVPANWIEKIAAAYDKDESMVGLTGYNALYSGAVSARTAGRYLFPLFWRFDKIISRGWNMVGFNMSVRKDAFTKIGGFNTSLRMGEDIDLSQKIRTVGKIKIDPTLIVFSSGRRFSRGLFAGLKSYAPWWISKVLLKRDQSYEFKDVRSEKKAGSLNFHLPTVAVALLLGLIFYFGYSKFL